MYFQDAMTICEQCLEPDYWEGQCWEEQRSRKLLKGVGVCQVFEVLFVFKCDIQTVKMLMVEVS